MREIVFSGQVVRPVCTYTYDAVYRLVEASGREHVAQCTYDPRGRSSRDYPFTAAGPAANDPNAFRNFTERYAYDRVGNIILLEHQAAGGAWTLHYDYGAGSNRLASSSLPGDANHAPFSAAYGHNAHGDITHMLGIEQIDWDFKDQLSASARQHRTNGRPETTYYTYNAQGQRVRKVTDASSADPNSGVTRYERIYLSGFELLRDHRVGGDFERETLRCHRW